MNKISLIALSIMLLLPISVSAEDNRLDEEARAPIANTLDEENYNETLEGVDYKEPISKRKIINKFLIAMLAVGGSSFLIYFGLSVYNKIRENFFENSSQDEAACLETPENYEEAVKTFLDKTNW